MSNIRKFTVFQLLRYGWTHSCRTFACRQVVFGTNVHERRRCLWPAISKLKFLNSTAFAISPQLSFLRALFSDLLILILFTILNRSNIYAVIPGTERMVNENSAVTHHDSCKNNSIACGQRTIGRLTSARSCMSLTFIFEVKLYKFHFLSNCSKTVRLRSCILAHVCILPR